MNHDMLGAPKSVQSRMAVAGEINFFVTRNSIQISRILIVSRFW